MGIKAKIAYVVLFGFLLGIGIIFVKYSNIKADTLSRSGSNCIMDIKGQLTQSHLTKNNNLKLILTNNGKIISEIVPSNNVYEFKLNTQFALEGSLNILATEKISNESLEYPVTNIYDAKCNFPVIVDLEI